LEDKRMRSERDILAEIRRLRHQLDRQRLTRTLAALKALQAENQALRAQLPRVASPTTAGDAQSSA
jgi:hypothetical protein